MPNCVIKGCNSGQRNCFEKHHFFQVPKDLNRQKLWQTKIDQQNVQLSCKHFVCDKHFKEEEIIKENKLFGPNGEVLGVSFYKIPRLKNDAFPTQNLSLDCLPKTVNSAAMKINTDENISNKENSSPNILEQIKITKNQLDKELSNANEKFVAVNECSRTSIKSNDNRFKEIVGTKKIRVPPMWSRFVWNNEKKEPERVVYSKSILINIDGVQRSLPIIELNISSNLNFEITVMGKILNPKTIGINCNLITDIYYVEDILQLLSSYNICSGYEKGANFETSVGFKDISNVLRHKYCELLLPIKERCTKCTNIIRNEKLKLQRANDSNGNFKRIRFTQQMSTDQMEKVKFINDKLNLALKDNKKLTKENEILKSELNKCHEQVSLCNINDVEVLMTKLNVNHHQKEAVRHILLVAGHKNAKQNRYSENWLLLSILIHMRSPKCYRFIRDNNILPLPGVSTIRRYLSLIEMNCGFDAKFFNLLKASFSAKSDHQKHGILILDEISTRKDINVKTQSLTYNGLIDFGDESLNNDCLEERNAFAKKKKKVEEANTHRNLSKLADHCLVLMFQSMYDDYAQPIAIFASQGPVPGVVLSQLIVKAIILLESIGAKVHGVTTDGATTNRKFWNEFGVHGTLNSTRCFTIHPLDENRKLFVFSDAPHLVKTIRNKIFNDGLIQTEPNKPPVKWDHIRKLLDVDTGSYGKVRCCPKLTLKHVELNNASKMRVGLATQVFSNTVVRALKFYQHYVPELRDCDETANFCKWINDLFDALNIRELSPGLSEDCEQFEVLQNAIKKLDQWENHVQSKKIPIKKFLTKPTAEGLRVTLHSTVEITKYMKEKYNCNFVYTYRLNQDALEKFFGTARLAGGTNDHPSTPTFLSIYKMLSLYSIIKPPATGNCIVLEENKSSLISLEYLKSIFSKSEKHSLKIITEKLDGCIDTEDWSFESNFEYDYSLPEITDCIIYQMTALLSNKILKSTKCKTCSQAIAKHSWNVKEQLLVDLNTKLTHPNQNFFNLIKYLEYIFQKHHKDENVMILVIDDIAVDKTLTFPCIEHKAEIVPYIIYNCISTRMQQCCHNLKSNMLKVSQQKKKAAKFYNN